MDVHVVRPIHTATTHTHTHTLLEYHDTHGASEGIPGRQVRTIERRKHSGETRVRKAADKISRRANHGTCEKGKRVTRVTQVIRVIRLKRVKQDG